MSEEVEGVLTATTPIAKDPQNLPPSSNALLENIKSFTAGGFGGVCAVLTGHPFDLMKVRLQTKQAVNTKDAFTSIIKNDGLKGFYRGVTPPLLGVTPMFAVSFWGYDVGKKLVLNYMPNENHDNTLTVSQISAAGFFSAIPTTAIAAPFERVKVTMQVQNTGTKMTTSQAVSHILKHGGLRSLFKGSAATLARDGPGSALYFATYEILKEKLSGSNKELSLFSIMVAGGFAGVAMWVGVFPVDTIKSVQQSSNASISMSQVARQIYQSKGIKGFFPGIGPALLRSFPANAATFLGVELARKALDDLF